MAGSGPHALIRQLSHRQDKFLSLLGAESDYELLRSELSVTPERVTPFTRAKRYQLALLRIKDLDTEQSRPSAIYSFKVNSIRGFQLGDPARDRFVRLELFDAGDHQFTFTIAVAEGTEPRLNQAGINRLIETFHAGPSGQPTGEVAK